MAHKKGVGSSKNGRESASKRLGVRSGVARRLSQVTLSFASAVTSTSQARTLHRVRTTHCMHLQTVLFTSTRASTIRVLFLSFQRKFTLLRL